MSFAFVDEFDGWFYVCAIRKFFCANVDALVAFVSQAAICKLTCLEVGGNSRFWFFRFCASFDERLQRLVFGSVGFMG